MRNNELILKAIAGQESEITETRCHDCGRALPRGKSPLACCCRTIGLCRYCYQHKFPQRPGPNYPAITNRKGERFLSCAERRKMERDAFETTDWSPEFYAEWLELWDEGTEGQSGERIGGL